MPGGMQRRSSFISTGPCLTFSGDGAYQTQSDQELNDDQHTRKAESSFLAESIIVDLGCQFASTRPKGWN
jgi:hypothetical protein